MNERKPLVVVASGHHNQDGGNAFEIETAGQLTPLIIQACRDCGLDAISPQPQDGAGMFLGGIWDVGDWVVDYHRTKRPVSVFVEVHTQGTANPGARGVFVIYPDWPAAADLDREARDRLGPLIGQQICRVIPEMPLGEVRGTGLMSERQSGVGMQGWRLGIFNRTAPIKETTTRVIVEYGSHTNPIEAAWHRDPAKLAAMAQATAGSLALFLGVPPPPNPSQPFQVGPGVREAMAVYGENPASNELYVDTPQGTISLTVGHVGNVYVWTPESGIAKIHGTRQ